MSEFLTITSTIADGNMSLRFGDEEMVLANRKQFLTKHHIAWESHTCMRCNHGQTIIAINRDTVTDRHYMLEAEVLVTQDTDLALMLLTADCLPTAFFDPITKTIALAHFSRQTIADGLPEKTIGFLRQTLKIDPANLKIQIGPYIHTNSYVFTKTDEKFAERLQPFLIETRDTIKVDLLAAHNHQLTEAGVPLENIVASQIDTVTSPEHFSHYATTRLNNKPHGRLATILRLIE